MKTRSPQELLLQFSSEEEVPFELLEGRSIGEGNFSFRKDPYYFMAGQKTDNIGKVINGITHVALNYAYRFSNSLIQLANIISFAKEQNINKIILPYFWYIEAGEHILNDGMTVINMNKEERYKVKSDDLVLKGNFFYMKTLANLMPVESGQKFLSKNLDQVKSIFNLNTATKPFSEKEIVIHIRSGDIFTGDGVNTQYGQPPLTYYKKVLQLEAPSKISIVCEDLNNPTIVPLIRHVDTLNLSYNLVSSSLADDINFMLSAQILVVGRGTFIPGVVSISNNIKKIYYFDSGFNTWGREDIDLIRVKDQKGEYIEKVIKCWKNTEEQKLLMLNYDSENLA